MKLIVGLGNPGEEYEKTRHNTGFLVLDAIAADAQFPIFNVQSKLNAQVSKGKIGDQNVILAKPQTFMNNSGASVKSLLQFYKIPAANLIVVHDEIDLPLGAIKVSRSSGSAGHKGVESIFNALGTQDFTRIRIGISPTEGKPADVEEFVLKRFSQMENKLMKQVPKNVITAVDSLLRDNAKQTI